MKLLHNKAVRRLLVLWVLWPALSYSSDYIYGYTGNAALNGNTWSMTTPVLGVTAGDGLDISGVIYQYTAVKELADDFTVTVQNEKVGGGYVFQDIEDWSQKYGMKIRKVVALPYTPIGQFKVDGGAIATTGIGSVEDATVLYMYRYDACFNPVDPSCPNYVPPPPPKLPTLYDALDDDSVKEATKETDSELYGKEEEGEEKDEEEEDEERLEVALSVAGNALTIANTFTQSAIVNAMNIATDINAYYVAQIPSKVYRESIVLKDKGISDNKWAFKNLSQDRIHNKIVQEQYK